MQSYWELRAEGVYHHTRVNRSMMQALNPLQYRIQTFWLRLLRIYRTSSIIPLQPYATCPQNSSIRFEDCGRNCALIYIVENILQSAERHESLIEYRIWFCDILEIAIFQTRPLLTYFAEIQTLQRVQQDERGAVWRGKEIAFSN